MKPSLELSPHEYSTIHHVLLAEFAAAIENPIAYQSKLEKHAQQLAVLEEDDELNGVSIDDGKPNETSQSCNAVVTSLQEEEGAFVTKEEALLNRARNSSFMSKGSNVETPVISRVGSINRNLVKQESTVSAVSHGSNASSAGTGEMLK